MGFLGWDPESYFDLQNGTTFVSFTSPSQETSYDMKSLGDRHVGFCQNGRAGQGRA